MTYLDDQLCIKICSFLGHIEVDYISQPHLQLDFTMLLNSLQGTVGESYVLLSCLDYINLNNSQQFFKLCHLLPGWIQTMIKTSGLQRHRMKGAWVFLSSCGKADQEHPSYAITQIINKLLL